LLKSVKGFEKSYSPRRQAPSRLREPLKAVMEPAAATLRTTAGMGKLEFAKTDKFSYFWSAMYG
jgi:hypothetical protein